MTNLKAYEKNLSNLLTHLTSLSQKKSKPIYRKLARTDLYFLLYVILGRKDIRDPWLFDRCQDVQNSPNGHLDLWARDHYKSTIITYAKTIQDVLASHGNEPLANSEVTVGIFSHTRPIAKGFLRQIKREFESNNFLKTLFDDILWANPQAESPKWSEDDGIIVKRNSNPKEATIEAWGLVDGQPTSKHFSLRVYDDVVTLASVTTPEMIKKTTEAWELADNLGTKDGHERYIGTRYHYNDTYREMMSRQVVDVRKHAITYEGTVDGDPVMLTRKQVADKRRKQGPYTFACQQLQEPMSDESQGFKTEWVRYYDDISPHGMNIYIIVDPAGEKKKGSDYTSMPVIGLGNDRNYYLIDWVYDKLNLTERASTLIDLHRKYRPKAVGYEKYGKDSDIEHIKTAQNGENYRFSIIELGGRLAKNDRIKRLVPTFEQGRFYLPRTMHRTNYEGRTEDLVQKFIHEEYKPFPVAVHDDGLDSMARIHDADLNVRFPGGAFGNQYDDWNVAVNS